MKNLQLIIVILSFFTLTSCDDYCAKCNTKCGYCIEQSGDTSEVYCTDEYNTYYDAKNVCLNQTFGSWTDTDTIEGVEECFKSNSDRINAGYECADKGGDWVHTKK